MWTHNRFRLRGGLDAGGYALGITFARDGRGLLWEDRGALLRTSDSARHWTAVKQFRPERDFGVSASIVSGRVAYFVDYRTEIDRPPRFMLFRSTDGGRRWKSVRTWLAR